MSKITVIRVVWPAGARYSWGFCDVGSLARVTELSREHGMEFTEAGFNALRTKLEATGVVFTITYLSRPVVEFELTEPISQNTDSREAAEAPAIQ